MQILLEWGKVVAPILIALIGIIPTIKNNANKTNEEIQKLNTNLNSIKGELKEHIKDNEWHEAKQTRIRILRFYDECCAGQNHSENHFEEVLDDIDSYEAYCASHPDYHNNKGKIAMYTIRKIYLEKKEKNNFL